MKTNLIYGLRDPRNDVYYYIGKTTVGNSRGLKHLLKSHNQSVNDWVQELESLGFIPEVDVIERNVLLENLVEREKYWIEYHYELNPELFNFQLLPNTISKKRTQEDDDAYNTLVKVLFSIGDILKNERKSRKLTQDELSIESGLSRSTISLCESGSNVTLDVLKKYVTTLKGIEILTKNLSYTRVSKPRSKKV